MKEEARASLLLGASDLVPILDNRDKIHSKEKIYYSKEKIYYSKVKIYPNKEVLIHYKQPMNRKQINYIKNKEIIISNLNCDRYILTEEEKEVIEKNGEITRSRSEIVNIENMKRASSRAKQHIYDIVSCNEWNYFVTFTFNKNKADRYNPKECVKLLTKYLNNLKQRKEKNLKYIVIPEKHKDGAYHFHGLIYTNQKEIFSDSGKNDTSGRTIYNIPSFKYGYTTAIECDNSPALAQYLCKYITKQTEERSLDKGMRRYYVSRNCDKPKITTYEKEIHPHPEMEKRWETERTIGYERKEIKNEKYQVER